MMDIFTIGHSNVTAEHIIDLLKQHCIEVLIDVRSVPYSRYNPQFNRESFQLTLQAAGIQYAYAGQSLGGRPDDPTCYEGDQVQYRRIMDRPWYQQGIDQLIERANGQRVALMCSEEDPLHCHRHNLIAQTLLERGITVWHIRGDGRLEQARPNPPEAQQLPLF
jgi:uncharacterized protein (DUF488 family)